MGIMGSALGRALGGFGAGVSALANKYVDEDLAKQRAQALADIQRMNAKLIREDEDAFRNDPNRLERDRANRRADALAAGKTAREVEMEGLNDTGLQDKKLEVAGKTAEFNRGQKVKDIEATAPAEATAAGLKKQEESKYTAYQLSPGQQHFIGDKLVASNGQQGSGKASKMDEADKLTYQELIKATQKADDELAKLASGGGMTTDKDGKPSEGYAYLTKQKDKAQRNLISFQMKKGLVDPEEAAMGAVAGEKNIDKIRQAISEAYSLGGSEFGEKFYAKVRSSGVLESLASDRAATKPAQQGSSKSSSGQASVQDMIAADKRAQASGSIIDREEVKKRRAEVEKKWDNIAKAQNDNELVAMSEEAKQLLRAGKPAQANAVIAKANELRMQRYGF